MFSDEQVSCLSAAEVGCNAIKVRQWPLVCSFVSKRSLFPSTVNCQDKNECLTSRDGRPYSQVAGFKVVLFNLFSLKELINTLDKF